jgi:hypothetical protein
MTLPELTTRQQEIYRLESDIIDAWMAGGKVLPHDAFVVLLSGARIACEQTPYADPQAAADRALDRLRRAAEAMRSGGVDSSLHSCPGCGTKVIGHERCGDPSRPECSGGLS